MFLFSEIERSGQPHDRQIVSQVLRVVAWVIFNPHNGDILPSTFVVCAANLYREECRVLAEEAVVPGSCEIRVSIECFFDIFYLSKWGNASQILFS